MAIIDYYLDTYNYFSILNRNPIQGKVLDYGSNYGMFFDSCKNRVNLEYTGLDVDLEAINYGRTMFPKAKFISYNRYNYIYNQHGNRNELPELDDYFDYIISYSVMTHTTQEDMMEMIDWLYTKLKPNAKMFITYLSIDNIIATSYFYNKRVKDFISCDQILFTDSYIYLVNNKITQIPSEAKFFLSFYNNSYLASLLNNYNFSLNKSPDKTNKCFQDCIIIEKG